MGKYPSYQLSWDDRLRVAKAVLKKGGGVQHKSDVGIKFKKAIHGDFFPERMHAFLKKHWAGYIGCLGELAFLGLIDKKDEWREPTPGGDDGVDVVLWDKIWDVKTGLAMHPLNERYQPFVLGVQAEDKTKLSYGYILGVYHLPTHTWYFIEAISCKAFMKEAKFAPKGQRLRCCVTSDRTYYIEQNLNFDREWFINRQEDLFKTRPKWPDQYEES